MCMVCDMMIGRRQFLRASARGASLIAGATALSACAGPFGSSRNARPAGKAGWSTDGRGDKIVFLHRQATDEYARVAYRKGRSTDGDAMKEIARLMRDDRTGKTMPIDINLVDLLYDIQVGTGTDHPLEILSAYRAPETNAAIRLEGSAAARHSLHMEGLAVDLRVKDASVEEVKNFSLSLSRGGVGYYPRQRFVHVDVGPVRTWWA